MKKIFVWILIIFLIAVSAKYLLHNISFIIPTDNNEEYKTEIIERCLTFEEKKENSQYNNECLINFNETFTPQNVEQAIDYAKKLKFAYRNQDINYLSNILVYPVKINNYNNNDLIINSKEDFLKLDKDILMKESIFKDIDSNRLFWNWQGYMLGNGNIWFWVDEKISNITINLN